MTTLTGRRTRMLAAAVGVGMLLPLLPLAGITPPAQAATTTKVVPSAYETQAAPSGNSIPFGCYAPQMRFQQVYAAAAVGTGGISKVAFRPDGSAWGAQSANVVLTLSTTSHAVDGLSLTWATNVGSDAREVFRGPLTLESAAGEFGVAIPFQRVFPFVQSRGNLLLDVSVQFASCFGSRFLDSVFSSTDAVSRAYAPSSSGTTAEGTNTTGLVTQFTFAPPAVAVAANSKTITFGDPAPTFDFTATSDTGDSLTGAPTCSVAGDHSSAGTYPITCSGATAASGVDITYTPGTLTVNKAPVSVTASSASIAFEDATPAVEPTVSGLLGDDALLTQPTCGLASERTGAGSFVTRCSGADAGGNYAVTHVDGLLTVAKGVQTVSFSTTAPTGVLVGSADYSPLADGRDSGIPVVISLDAASSGCTLSDGVVSMTHPGTCVINADQAESADFAAGHAQQSFTISQLTQTLAFSSDAPEGAVVGDADYTPTFSAGASGEPVDLVLDEASTGCTLSSGVVSMTHAGTCILNASQAGNIDYSAALPVQQSFTIGQLTQTVAFSSTAPGDAVVGAGSYTPTADGGGSGNPVTFSLAPESSGCSLSGGVVSFDDPGTCILSADQEGSTDYSAASQVQQSFTISPIGQAVTFTSTAPDGAVVGGADYTPAATGGGSGNPVVFTLDEQSTGCTLSGGVVSMSHAGTCVVNADQAGDGDHSAGHAQQSFSIGAAAQTLVFTSSAPSGNRVGDASYTPTVTGGGSSSPVVLSLDATSTGCTLSGGVVAMSHAGTCVLNANQAGDSDYTAAAQVQQSFTIGQLPQVARFTSPPPVAVVAGAHYTPKAAGTASGNPVVISLSPTSTGCTLTRGVVAFPHVGVCRLLARQAGSTNYLASPSVEQAFVIGKAAQRLRFANANPIGVVGGLSYRPVVSGGRSGKPVIVSVDRRSTGCTLRSGVVFFDHTGVCVIHADQAGTADYAPAPRVTQTLTVTGPPAQRPVSSGGMRLEHSSSGGVVRMTTHSLAAKRGRPVTFFVSVGNGRYVSVGVVTVDVRGRASFSFRSIPGRQLNLLTRRVDANGTLAFTEIHPQTVR